MVPATQEAGPEELAVGDWSGAYSKKNKKMYNFMILLMEKKRMFDNTITVALLINNLATIYEN